VVQQMRKNLLEEFQDTLRLLVVNYDAVDGVHCSVAVICLSFALVLKQP
jgi:hypothetical protein